MRPAAAMAGMASAAMLLAPGCGAAPKSSPSADEPVRRANFRSLAARDFLLSCAGAAGRGETRIATARHEELKQLGVGAEAGHALALGENDWAGLQRHDRRAPCAAGETPYRAALAAYGRSLDALAARLADHGAVQ
ncbi:MAG TPA: hypothetical protein VLK25_10150 [Allosphingosinicella sp.]|nr:hypothetical protein [Allosphingosinicella sp.]